MSVFGTSIHRNNKLAELVTGIISRDISLHQENHEDALFSSENREPHSRDIETQVLHRYNVTKRAVNIFGQCCELRRYQTHKRWQPRATQEDTEWFCQRPPCCRAIFSLYYTLYVHNIVCRLQLHLFTLFALVFHFSTY